MDNESSESTNTKNSIHNETSNENSIKDFMNVTRESALSLTGSNNANCQEAANKQDFPCTSDHSRSGDERLSQESMDSITCEGEIINNLLTLVQMRENLDQIQQFPIKFSKYVQEEDHSPKNVSILTSSGLIAGSRVSVPSLASRIESVPEFEINITPPPCAPIVLYSAPPISGAPPTYSAVMRIGPVDMQPGRSMRLFGRRQEVRMQPSPPFIAPIPPPTYAESHGNFSQPRHLISPLTHDLQDPLWGPDPISTICPACGHFVITTVHTRRSNLTHFSAMALCICGCWPCCLLPYCLKACKTSYHECPVCLTLIGVYNPM